ncbi:MAG TPA: PVC-type heme-binding CxxCH protein, partial [Gemmataceae bacterium]|nr:PVC-type heme-binding CxxCH protein [Gemmataceae bacterium]
MNAAILSLALLSLNQPPDAGVLPVGADGKPLNLDFETGTLKDWAAEGAAFRDQPVKGDTVSPRRGDSKSRHQGEFWIGGYEKYGDKPVGVLTSEPFKVTHPWASFLVGGGPHELETCVELVDVAGKSVFFRAAGLEEEDLRRVVVDLSKMQGKEIQVRVVDKHTGHWGHVNFDDFRFHAEKPNVPQRPKKGPPPKQDVVTHAGLKPEEAAKAMTVPDGFSVQLFAGEPDVHQPIAFCFDDRGRLWVVEAFTYPRRNPHPGPIIPDKKLGDRIIIFEDADGDGKFDTKKTFMEGLNLVSGIEVGFGGVWVGAAPYFLFIPHDEKTDKAGESQILLDGWGYEDTHETLNTFVWGPDGWLYGCHGVFTHSKVGKPGTPEKDRQKINAGVWRYHPTRHVFEVFAHGTSNPWGLDYNANGDFFIEACVIPHMWHIVQGGRYARQAGPHVNPYTYDDIKTIAVHRHYAGPTPHA